MARPKSNKIVVESLCAWISSIWLFFTKNVIDINKLDGALAFQIHRFDISFYLNQLNSKGIYIFNEIAHLRFPQSLEDLPSLFTMMNVKKFLGVNHVFWDFCKNQSILMSLKEGTR
ncbi:hypothetical protein G6F57_005892 [Rhizopus arrhizus]|uniref:Uncharacterized protein n=1 Tax=Rhizopus oryzae TaxID=64495 RepID=A0A9P7BN05_RHIOR|nr:hypothetical protein G6F23_007296 [Rhizopus arrhizus]KAG1415675.1 hypothetical protein G6F58_006366 [Rhizopus delemar]KAG0756315.1 hypothetical protein G6F24_011235 [Rhizopus arrhizus]KAG0785466.1 hypothetical protein G6F21_009239 [Rhizopus arrhizus]KAG0787846.1 hypothetical protein G6F22_007185 [Rhizopus arrhizus]